MTNSLIRSVLVAALMTGVMGAAFAEERKPNILIITSDDTGSGISASITEVQEDTKHRT